MKLSVVIPVYNGGSDLRLCLQALGQASRKPDEVIVVDDGSTDGAPACAAEFSAKVIHLKGPRGPAVARNHGAREAGGDVLVFVDADVMIHADTLERFERLFTDNPEVSAAFGSYDDRPPARGNVSRYKNLLHHYVHQQGGGDAETFWAGCGCVRREAFLAMDGFAETYARPSIEDIELGVRLREAGHRIVLRPEIQCTHLKRWTLGSLLRTDIFSRAVPWSRLIVRQGQLPSGLNTDSKSRWSAMLAWLAAMAVPTCLVSAGLGCLGCSASAAGLAAAFGLVLIALNRAIYRFFFGHGGLVFGVTAVSLHVLYLLYGSLVFCCVLGAAKLRGSDG